MSKHSLLDDAKCLLYILKPTHPINSSDLLPRSRRQPKSPTWRPHQLTQPLATSATNSAPVPTSTCSLERLRQHQLHTSAGLHLASPPPTAVVASAAGMMTATRNRGEPPLNLTPRMIGTAYQTLHGRDRPAQAPRHWRTVDTD